MLFLYLYNKIKQIGIMKVAANNIELNKCKEVMKSLMVLIKDSKTNIEDKKQYYSEYLQLSANSLIMSR